MADETDNREAPHVMIVEAPYYADIAEELARGAIEALKEAGASFDRFPVAGAFEIPGAISAAHKSQIHAGRKVYDGYIALGCVIRGETTHYDYICQESARALMNLSVERNLAIGNGILTVENRTQAWARASMDGKNKGGEAARACLGMILLKQQFGLEL